MALPHAPAAPLRRPEVVTVYAIGLFQGLSLVAFPAAATILTSTAGYDLSKSQYGLLFLPQVVLAIAGSLSLPAAAARFGLKKVLVAGLSADTLAMVLLAASNSVRADAVAFPMLLVATGFLGLGFGLTLGSISTYAGSFMPARRDVALTALNVLLGLGTALSPFLVSFFYVHAQWWYLPLLSAAGLAVLIVATLVLSLEAPRTGRRAPSRRVPASFWVFAVALVSYGIGETMFGNWGTTMLVERGIKATSATDALGVFWASVTLGRLFIALASGAVRSTRIYLVLPWAMAAALFLVPMASGASEGIAVFAFGGLACSGFFPLTIGYGEGTFPNIVELATGWLIAAYQVGYGLAAFGGGAIQSVVKLSTVFRIAALLAIAMALVSIPIVHRQRPAATPAVGAAA